MKKILCLTLLLLSGCGGSSEPAESSDASPSANNPLADEQALIRQAEGLQGVLDENADRKKEQLPE